MPTLRRARRPTLGLALGSLLLLLVPATAAADRDVRIVDFAYSPTTVTIRVGDTVTWTNRDPLDHTATATNGAFDTGLIGADGSASIRFTRAGTYRYICTPHPDMRGTVVVRARSSRPPDTATAVDAETATMADADAPPTGSADGSGPDIVGLGFIGLAAMVVTILRLSRRRETAEPPGA